VSLAVFTTRQPARIPSAAWPTAAAQAVWFVTGAALAFAIPYVFSSVLDLQHDLYLLIYFVGIGAFLGAYVTATRADVAGLFRRGWKLSLALGVLATGFCVANVLGRDATPRPDGAYFDFELVWRGVAYGAIDALLLTAFPVLVVYRLFGGQVRGWMRRVELAAAALALTMVITATYHLGYAQYREDGLANPEVGNTVISVPAIVSMNPVGSLVTHAAMHVTAVTHAYETPVFLPPQTDAK
jgi:hypothetical protein